MYHLLLFGCAGYIAFYGQAGLCYYAQPIMADLNALVKYNNDEVKSIMA